MQRGHQPLHEEHRQVDWCWVEDQAGKPCLALSAHLGLPVTASWGEEGNPGEQI